MAIRIFFFFVPLPVTGGSLPWGMALTSSRCGLLDAATWNAGSSSRQCRHELLGAGNLA